MGKRVSDRLRTGLLLLALAFASFWPAIRLLAQSQDAINATLAEKLSGLVLRIDKIESMINTVLIALAVNFIAMLVQIVRAPDRRRDR